MDLQTHVDIRTFLECNKVPTKLRSHSEHPRILALVEEYNKSKFLEMYKELYVEYKQDELKTHIECAFGSK